MFTVGNIISVGCAKFLSKAQAGLGLLSPKGSGRQTTYIAKLLTLLWGLAIVAGSAQAQIGPYDAPSSCGADNDLSISVTAADVVGFCPANGLGDYTVKQR